MSAVRRGVMAAVVTGSLLVGGVGGAALYALTTVSAAAATTPSPSPSATTPGKFVPNEDPTHEAGESAAREAQENAGQVPTVP